MPITTAQQPWYLAERAESLAVISLTDNPQIEIVRRYERDSGLEILARLREDGKPSGRFLGVEVRAALSELSDAADLKTYDRGGDAGSYLRDIPFPVCLMLFAVDRDRGYWGWVRQPNINDDNDDGRDSLKVNARVVLSELTKESVNGIASDVTRWYEYQSGRK